MTSALDLVADVRVQRGTLALTAELTARAGETLALVGPNGAGKSTILGAIAGLVPLDAGRIALRDERGLEQVLDGGPTGPFLPPETRGIGFVFQDVLLFPHLTVLDNVAYGARCRGRGRREAREGARLWLARVGLADASDARPAELSGGQRQRAGLARALASEPRVLLLDEPLSQVDVSTRLALRRELAAHLASFAGPRLLVVHDPLDAFALADRVAVLESGRLVQIGTPAEVARRPISRYVADLVGLNAFRGRARGNVVSMDSGAELTFAPDEGTALTGPVVAVVHPRAVALYRQRPEGSPRNVWRAPILGSEPVPGGVRVELGGPLPLFADVTEPGARALGLDARHDRLPEVWVTIKASEVSVAPA